VGSSEQTSTVDHPAPVVQEVVVTEPATTKTIVSPSTPVVATTTNHVPKATNVTIGEKIVGPLTSIRNFFKHLFSPDPRSS